MIEGLFASLYLDEDVNVLLAKLMRARKFSALTASEADRLGLTDEEQLAYATSEGRAIVTHNRLDFEQLAVEWLDEGRSHAGIIIATRRAAHDLCNRLAKLLNTASADEMANQLWYI